MENNLDNKITCKDKDHPVTNHENAAVVKLVDTQRLGRCEETRGGSSPLARTKHFVIFLSEK